jgi:hypothetical protein
VRVRAAIDGVQGTLLVPGAGRDRHTPDVVHAARAPEQGTVCVFQARHAPCFLGEDRHATAMREGVHTLHVAEAAEGHAAAVDIIARYVGASGLEHVFQLTASRSAR